MNNEPKTFENLKAIEADLFGAERGGQTHGEAPKTGGDEQLRNSWKLNQEVLDAKRISAALKEELKTAQIFITEQNVLATSSRSALKEMRKDVELAKTAADQKDYEIADLNSQVDRLKSELAMERKRNGDLREKLGQDAAIRQDMENLLLEAEQIEEAQQREIEALTRELKEKTAPPPAYSRLDRPARYVRRHF